MKNDEILSKNLENQEIKTDISEKGNCIIKINTKQTKRSGIPTNNQQYIYRRRSLAKRRKNKSCGL